MPKILPSKANSPYASTEAEPFMNDTQKDFLKLNTSKYADVYERGSNGFPVLTSLPVYNAPINSKSLNMDDSWICLGPDAPQGPGTGQGKTGTRAASVDIVCGRLAAIASAAKNENGFVNNSFQYDAARLYVSQLTNVDESTSLPTVDGGNQPFEERSGLVGIADNVALKGRLGVKIVTAPPGESNSAGGLISSGTGIELIAKSDASSVQPLVKGDNLVDALGAIYSRIDELNDAIMDIAAENIALSAALAAHVHPVILPAMIAGPSPVLIAPAIKTGMTNAWSGPITGIKRKLNLLFDEINYTYSVGSKYINSDLNRTN